MSKVPIGSAGPPKRRKKNQSKTRRSCTNGRNKRNAVENVSVPANETLHESSGNRVTYGSTDHSDGKSVTTATPIPIGSVAPTSDTQPFSKPQSAQVEAGMTSEKLFPLDGCDSPFIYIWDERFTPGTPANMMQSHVASVTQKDPDIEFVWNPFQDERLRTVKSEEETMGTITAINFDVGTSAPFPHMDFNFGHSSIVSTPDTKFDFNVDTELDVALSAARLPIRNWPMQNFSSAFSGPTATDELYSESPQLQQIGLSIDLGQDNISSSNANSIDKMAVLFDTSFQEQDSLGQKYATKPLINSYSNTPQYGAKISEISLSAQTASSGKGPRKRPSSGDDGCDGGEDANLTNCGQPPRDNGGERLLACPFHKKDPQRYQDCSKYTLRRIKDVKQHIYRLHCKPELYCSRCFENFKCSNERDHHIREGGCALQDMPKRDGIISDSQRKELKECRSRGTSKQKQWMELWNVVFPGAKPPRSPHIESGQAELLSSLRSYWDGNADEIIARSVGKHDPECLNSGHDSRFSSASAYIGQHYPMPISRGVVGHIRDVVDIILDYFESNPTNWDSTTNKERDGTPQLPQGYENSVEDLSLSPLFLLD
ncbi:hypothetical protein F4859DRAFT_515422 [Xylaria cf. heliscus]|nr:hypothetical protein F4859DRAFT_515422 [Xylaria cf. heliscus]